MCEHSLNPFNSLCAVLLCNFKCLECIIIQGKNNGFMVGVRPSAVCPENLEHVLLLCCAFSRPEKALEVVKCTFLHVFLSVFVSVTLC